MISSVFRGIGQKFSLNMALNIYVSIINPFLGSSFNILGVTLSISGAFLFLRELISSLISFGESIFTSGICSGKVVILSSISWSGSLSLGVKTFERCTAKSAVFLYHFEPIYLVALLSGFLRAIPAR
jgi:hypothetical protein